jgi:hypothetical protein
LFIFLIIVGIWLLLNVLFVVVWIPPRKQAAPLSSDKQAPAVIDKDAYRFYPEGENPSMKDILISIAMGTFFVLSLPIANALDGVKRAFKNKPPAE